MKTLPRALTVALSVILAGCGADPSASSGSDAATQAPTTRESAPAPRDTPAADTAPDDTGISAVTLRRGGGLKPSTVSRVFAADKPPPPGFTRAEVQAVLAAASSFEASDAELAPVPRNTCCDRYGYEVTIDRVDGGSTSYSTIDGLKQPPSFARLLHDMS